MRTIKMKPVILAIVFCAGFSWAGHADSLATRNCTWCHGPSGQGYNPAPRLAGQKRQYIEYQLSTFLTHTRDNPDSKLYMWGAAANLSRQKAHFLATYFSELPPVAANDGHQELAGLGRTIYQDGIPDANIVACIACHGPNGEGAGEIPRVGGLAYTYLKRRLKQWGEGYNLTARWPMVQVAAKLSPSQIEALASYLSFVK
jgi:cytochrome c553